MTINNSAETELLDFIKENPDVSYTDIAEHLGCSISAICRLCQRNGIHRRKRTSINMHKIQSLSGLVKK